MRKDLHHNIKPVNALPLSTINTNATTNGVTVDRQGFGSLEFLIISGTLSDGNFAINVQHGNMENMSDAVNVPVNQLLGTVVEASFSQGQNNVAHRIGYLGIKRYVRITVTSTNVSSGGQLCAIAILANPDFAPTSNP